LFGGLKGRTIQIAEATVICTLSLALLLFVFVGAYEGEFIAGGRYGVGGRLLSQQEEPTRFWAAIGVVGTLSVAGLWFGLMRFWDALKKS